MVLVLVVAALATAAVVLTGSADLGRLRLRAVRLLLAAAVVQVAISVLAPASGLARAAALGLTAVLVGLFVIGNRRLAGAPLLAAGLLLNLVVVAANGAMPVSLSAARAAGLEPAELGLARDALREPMDEATWLPWLGDVIPFALPMWPQVVSPGDVLVAAGVGLLLVAARPRSPRVAPQTDRRAARSTMLDSDSTTTGSYS